MKTINVNASRNYDVVVGSDLIPQLGSYAAALTNAKTVAIISDSNVWPIYGQAVTSSLLNAGFHVCNYVFPAGEESKNGDTYFKILNFFAQSHITRSDLVVALGGGVTGDITGFAAATYLRGIKYIQVPTSLLAMVDSSVGGKTAIDLPYGKNLVGAFYQPILVLCDIGTLKTLPRNIFIDGCSEVVKYAILFDSTLFSHLSQEGIHFHTETVISRCIELKRDIVAQDEFDTSTRQKLNLGHTIGHAIEANSNFMISHGQAVAMGIAIISRSAYAEGLCSLETLEKILSVLAKFSLPVSCDYNAHQLYTSALSDKKRKGNSIDLIVPKAIGCCEIRQTAVDALENIIQAGL